MNERLIVKNFLCLKDIDIEVKDFLILLGPQAAGKSLCAKLLYFFRAMYGGTLFSNLDIVQADVTEFLRKYFNIFFLNKYWSATNFSIEYKPGGYKSGIYFKIAKKAETPDITIDIPPDFLKRIEAYKHSLQELRSYTGDVTLAEFSTITIMGKVQPLIKNSFISSQEIFIPNQRCVFNLIQGNIFSMLLNNQSIDIFIALYGIFFEKIKTIENPIPKEAHRLIHSICKGDYVPKDSALLHEDGRKIDLKHLSSGRQSSLPIALILAHIPALSAELYDFTNIYIEEPEAHLFPEAQEQITRLIGLVQHSLAQKTGFVITTHSPYMLTAFNNLIMAGNIVKQNPECKEAVCKIIPESMHIDIDRFSAYFLADGKAVSIINRENNLIDAETIDGVSASIGETFGKLLDIEFESKKEGGNV